MNNLPVPLDHTEGGLEKSVIDLAERGLGDAMGQILKRRKRCRELCFPPADGDEAPVSSNEDLKKELVAYINASEYLAYQLEVYVDLVSPRWNFHDAMEAAMGSRDDTAMGEKK